MSHAYDGFGRLVSTTTHIGGSVRTVSHRYDREGGEVETTFPDGRKFWTARDGLGRMVGGYQGSLGDQSMGMIAFNYDGSSNLYYVVRRWGISTFSEFDGIGRPARVYQQFGRPAALQGRSATIRPARSATITATTTLMPTVRHRRAWRSLRGPPARPRRSAAAAAFST